MSSHHIPPVPPEGDSWLALTSASLPIGPAHDWAVVPSAGAVVLFSGTVRDHAPGRDGVSGLTYEAYEEQVVPKLAEIEAELRTRWPSCRRVGLLHRVGDLDVGESSVVVVVSAPHRPDAFAAARFGIDALKATVPIWKKETWPGGEEWSPAATDLVDAASVSSPEAAR
jgi:molybdopterin synthase catalytic subunit